MPYFIKTLHGFVKKIKETECLRDRLQSGRPSLCVKGVEEVHNIQQEVLYEKWIHRKQYSSKICSLLCGNFPIDSSASKRYNLETGNSVWNLLQQRLD